MSAGGFLTAPQIAEYDGLSSRPAAPFDAFVNQKS
jgi:hypothetical protein